MYRELVKLGTFSQDVRLTVFAFRFKVKMKAELRQIFLERRLLWDFFIPRQEKRDCPTVFLNRTLRWILTANPNEKYPLAIWRQNLHSAFALCPSYLISSFFQQLVFQAEKTREKKSSMSLLKRRVKMAVRIQILLLIIEFCILERLRVYLRNSQAFRQTRQ